MNLKNAKNVLWVSLILVLVLVSGCNAGQPMKENSDSSSGSEKQIADGKPVTIKVFQMNAGITDQEFQENFVDPVKNKFPNVTMELVRSGKGTTKEELVASGQFPDIILTTSWDMTQFLEMNLMTDLNEFIRKTKFDVDQFEKNTVDSIKLYSDRGELFALPYSFNFEVLYYNKTIFDKTGLPYPKDGMTWEEIIDIGKKLAAKDPSVRTIDPNGLRWVAQSYMMPFVDPKSEKATVTTDDWKYLFQMFKTLEDIPDNKKSKLGVVGFEKDQTLAMYASSGGRLGEIEELYNQGVTLNWDMVSFPLRKGFSSKEVATQAHVLAVSSTAKNKDDIFEIVSFLTTNKEIQMKLARKGALPVLKDKELKEQFGKDLKSLQGKNIQAVFKNEYGTMGKPTKYDDMVKNAVQDALNRSIKENLDVNTTIRIAQEESDLAISAEKARQK